LRACSRRFLTHLAPGVFGEAGAGQPSGKAFSVQQSAFSFVLAESFDLRRTDQLSIQEKLKADR